MNQSAPSLDPYGDIDPDSQRYGRALRRATLPIAVASLVCGLALALLVGGTSSTTTVSLNLTNPSSTLSDVGLTQFFDGFPSSGETAGYANAIDDKIDLSGTVAAVADPAEKTHLTVTVSEGDSDDVTAVLADLDGWIGMRRSGAVQDFSAVVGQQRAAVEARRDELDQSITTLPASDALREALLDERSDLTTAILELDNTELSLAAFAASPERFEVVTQETAESNSRLVWFIVGAILGMLVAVGIVLVIAHADRRVRTVAELESIAGRPVWPPIPTSGPERAVAVAAVSASLPSSGSDVTFVPVDRHGASEAALVAESVSGATVCPLDAITGIPAGQSCVPVVVSGKSHGDDVTRVMAYLDALGHPTPGVLFVGIGPNQLRRVVE